MASADDLQQEAADLRAKEAQHNAEAQMTDSASDEAVARYRAEDAKVKAEEKERRAKEEAKREAESG